MMTDDLVRSFKSLLTECTILCWPKSRAPQTIMGLSVCRLFVTFAKTLMPSRTCFANLSIIFWASIPTLPSKLGRTMFGASLLTSFTSLAEWWNGTVTACALLTWAENV